MMHVSRAARGLVIDSHIAFKIGPSPVLARAIVLRCNPVILERRLKKKNWPKDKISENLLAEILGICLWDAVQNYGWQGILEIDTTHKRPKEVLDLALRALKQKRNQKKPKVDWLSTLRREGMLERYLI
jgi:adenylate kinase